MSVKDWLTEQAERNPDLPFLIMPGRSFSYAEIERMVAGAAAGLAPSIRHGQLVGVVAASTTEAVVMMLSVPRAGGILVPINPRLTAAETDDLCDRLGVDLVVRHLPSGDGTPEPMDADAPWVVVPTSGTTGHPKGVTLTGRNLVASASASAAFLEHRQGDRWLCVLPLHHVGGLSILTRSLHAGGAVVLEPKFDAQRAAILLRDVRFASFVPTMLSRVLEYAEAPYPHLSAVLVGGGPLPSGLLEAARSVGMPAVPTYGATETAAQIATGRPGEGTVRPLPGVEIAIAGSSIGDDAVGEIVVDGPMISPGYWGQPDRSGPYRTGDLGMFDSAGNLTVFGRSDDMVITGGENVYPIEIERELLANPGVSDVAVWGADDAQWGRIVHAAVVAPGVSEDTLERWVRKRLARHKVPKVWHMVDAVPRSPMGKLDRKALEG